MVHSGIVVGLINLKFWIIIGGVRTIIHLTLSSPSSSTERASVLTDSGATCPVISPVSRSPPVRARRQNVMVMVSPLSALSLNTPTLIMKLVKSKTNSRRKTICAGNLRQTDSGHWPGRVTRPSPGQRDRKLGISNKLSSAQLSSAQLSSARRHPAWLCSAPAGCRRRIRKQMIGKYFWYKSDQPASQPW